MAHVGALMDLFRIVEFVLSVVVLAMLIMEFVNVLMDIMILVESVPNVD